MGALLLPLMPNEASTVEDDEGGSVTGSQVGLRSNRSSKQESPPSFLSLRALLFTSLSTCRVLKSYQRCRFWSHKANTSATLQACSQLLFRTPSPHHPCLPPPVHLVFDGSRSPPTPHDNVVPLARRNSSTPPSVLRLPREHSYPRPLAPLVVEKEEENYRKVKVRDLIKNQDEFQENKPTQARQFGERIGEDKYSIYRLLFKFGKQIPFG